MAAILIVTLLVLVGCGGEGGGTASTAAPGEPLTVSEALASDLDEPLLVQGLFLQEGDGQPLLCETSLDSLPPQCGEPSLQVNGAVPDELDGAKSSGRVTWVDTAQLLGRVEGDVMTVSDTQT